MHVWVNWWNWKTNKNRNLRDEYSRVEIEEQKERFIFVLDWRNDRCLNHHTLHRTDTKSELKVFYFQCWWLISMTINHFKFTLKKSHILSSMYVRGQMVWRWMEWTTSSPSLLMIKGAENNILLLTRLLLGEFLRLENVQGQIGHFEHCKSLILLWINNDYCAECYKDRHADFKKKHHEVRNTLCPFAPSQSLTKTKLETYSTAWARSVCLSRRGLGLLEPQCSWCVSAWSSLDSGKHFFLGALCPFLALEVSPAMSTASQQLIFADAWCVCAHAAWVGMFGYICKCVSC